MKKMFCVLAILTVVFLTACGNDDHAEKNEAGSEGNEQQTENDSSDKEKKKEYQIGETAESRSNANGLPYKITVNSFKLTTSDVEGYSLEDFNFDAEEGGKFALANITIKNISDEEFVPKSTLSGFLTSEMEDIPSDDEFFY